LPSHEEHCQQSLRRYGKTFSELHKWMDEPSEILGYKHRMYRHDPYTTPHVARRLFGEYADEACLDHIRLDREMSRGIYAPVSAKPLNLGRFALAYFLGFIAVFISVSQLSPVKGSQAVVLGSLVLLIFISVWVGGLLAIPLYFLFEFLWGERQPKEIEEFFQACDEMDRKKSSLGASFTLNVSMAELDDYSKQALKEAEKQDYSLALELLEKSLQDKPKSKYLLLLKAWFTDRLQQKTEHTRTHRGEHRIRNLADLDRSLRLFRDYMDFLERALDSLEEALAIDPNFSEAQELLRCYKGRLELYQNFIQKLENLKRIFPQKLDKT